MLRSIAGLFDSASGIAGLAIPVSNRLSRGGSSIRARLILLVGAVMIPLIVLSGAGVWYAYATERSRSEQALVGRAKAIAAAVDREFDTSLTALRLLASSRALAQGDLKGFDGEMRTASAALGGMTINLTSITGEITLTTYWPPGFRRKGAQASAFLLDSLRKNQAAVSDLIIGPLSHTAQVGVALPVPPAQGSVAWWLSLYLPTGTLERQLKSFNLPDGWLAAVVDRQDHIVARTRDPDRYIGQKPSPDMITAARTSDAGLVTAGHVAADGVPTLSAFARAPQSGYLAAIGMPESDFTGPLRTTLLQAGGFAVLLGAFGLGGALLVSRNIVGAFRRLGMVAPGAVPHTGVREIDEVAAAIAAGEMQRRESEVRLDMAAEAGGIGMIDWNLADDTVTYSEQAKAMFGFPAGRPVSLDMVRTAIHPEDRPSGSPLRTPAVDPGSEHISADEYRIIRPDGSVRWLLAHGRALFDVSGEAGRMVRYLGTVQDITARREAEERLHGLNQHLEVQVHAEVAAREAAQARALQSERMQALGQLAAGIAHDFNNVLQAVTGGVSTIERRAEQTDRVRQLARMVLEAAERGASVTRRLLMFARKGDLRTEPVNPAQLLWGVREILVHTLGARITVAADPDADLPPLLADRGQLESVLVNLATNARDAMPDGGAITMRAGLHVIAETGHEAELRPGRYIRLLVADTGVGMDAETLARAAEPFFSTKAAGAGTGLGLAMARGFAEQSGGTLHLHSVLGEGTTVSVWLPVAEEAVRPERPASHALTMPNPVRAHVLVVDDDAAVRESLAAGLSELGHRVWMAESGEAALEVIQLEDTIECVVTDLSMPGMDGVALVKAARQLRPALHAIVLTGYAGHEALSAQEEIGLYQVLWKPADLTRIAERIADAAGGMTPGPTPSSPDVGTMVP